MMEASRLRELLDKVAEHHAHGLSPAEILPYLTDEERDLNTLMEAVLWFIQQGPDPATDVLGKLPHTRDGEAVVPFVDWVWSPAHHDLVGRPLSFEVNQLTPAGWYAGPALVSECFSTRELCEVHRRSASTRGAGKRPH